MIRTANIEVSLQRLSILRIEHPQANPLKLACTLRAGETLPSGLTVTAEIHTSRNVAAETTPLASSTVTVAPGATSFEVAFDSPQTNQTVTPDSVRACWMVVYGVADDDTVYTLSAADLLLGWHAISQVTAAPPNVTLFVEKGGVAWATGRDYQAGTMVTAGTTAYVATAGHTSSASTEPGEGASWETVWTVLSGGGGGGATNLGITSTATAVTITNDNGDGVEIPEVSETDAGVMSAELRNKLVDLPTADTLGALATRDTVGTSQIDNDSVGELQIANNAVTSAKIAANAVTYAKMQAVGAASRLLGRGTAGTTAAREISLGTGLSMSGDVLSATATGGGTKSLPPFLPINSQPPEANFATRDQTNTTSPIDVLDFDPVTNEFAIWTGLIPEGFNMTGGLKARITWKLDTATPSGNVVWAAQIERGNTDLRSDSWDSAHTATGAANVTAGIATTTEITLTNVDGVQAGENFRVRIYRDASAGADTAAFDAELMLLEIRGN
jgi:hypothetical protein